jgi:hypothetical protein
MSRSEIRSRIDLLSYEYIVKHASSQEKAEAIWAIRKAMSPNANPRPIEQRFPVKWDPFILELLRQVTTERDELKRELPLLRKQLEQLKFQHTSY